MRFLGVRCNFSGKYYLQHLLCFELCTFFNIIKIFKFKKGENEPFHCPKLNVLRYNMENVECPRQSPLRGKSQFVFKIEIGVFYII